MSDREALLALREREPAVTVLTFRATAACLRMVNAKPEDRHLARIAYAEALRADAREQADYIIAKAMRPQP